MLQIKRLKALWWGGCVRVLGGVRWGAHKQQPGERRERCRQPGFEPVLRVRRMHYGGDVSVVRLGR